MEFLELDVTTPSNSTEQSSTIFRCDGNSGSDTATLSSSNVAITSTDKLFSASAVVINHTTDDAGTEYKVEITSNPFLYMEGIGMIMDVTDGASLNNRTSYTATQIQSNVDLYQVRLTGKLSVFDIDYETILTRSGLSLKEIQNQENPVLEIITNIYPTYISVKNNTTTVEVLLTNDELSFKDNSIVTTSLLRTQLKSTGTFDISVPVLTLNNSAVATEGQVITCDSNGKPSWQPPFVSGQTSVGGSSTGTITAVGVTASTPIVATLFSLNSLDIGNILRITQQTTDQFTW
jgi:hypothetical protein